MIEMKVKYLSILLLLLISCSPRLLTEKAPIPGETWMYIEEGINPFFYPDTTFVKVDAVKDRWVKYHKVGSKEIYYDRVGLFIRDFERKNDGR